MFNKDRFHNQLALYLGYQRIVNDKHININIDDKLYTDDMKVSISIDGFPRSICYKASEGLSPNELNSLEKSIYDEIKIIVDAVNKAYNNANMLF